MAICTTCKRTRQMPSMQWVWKDRRHSGRTLPYLSREKGLPDLQRYRTQLSKACEVPTTPSAASEGADC